MTSDPTADLVVHGMAPLLRLLRETEPGRPRLTWYGVDGERVELSGRVLDNWVAKTANLLVDELDVGPGSRVLLHLPVHWRTATWLLAVWAVGACAVLPPEGALGPLDVGTVDVVVTDRPQLVGELVAAGAQLVVQPLPALAVRWTGALPDGALDATSEVRGQGDVFTPLSAAAGDDPALEPAPGIVVEHGALFGTAGRALAAVGWAARPRVLVEVGDTDGRPLDPTRWLLAALAADGSVVVVESTAGSDDLARKGLDVAAQEGVTARW